MIQRLPESIPALLLKVATFNLAVFMAIIILHRGVALQLINVFVKSPYHRVQRLVDSFQTLTAANVDSTRAPQPLVVTVLEVPAFVVHIQPAQTKTPRYSIKTTVVAVLLDRAPQPLVVTVLEVPASATRNLASMRLRMYILSHLANVAMQ